MNRCIQNPIQKIQRNKFLNRAIIIFLCFAVFLSVFYVLLPIIGLKAQSQEIIDEIKSIAPDWQVGEEVPLNKMEEVLDGDSGLKWSAFVAAKTVYGGELFTDTINQYLIIKFPQPGEAVEDGAQEYFQKCIGALWDSVPILTSLGIGLLCVWLFIDIIEKTTADSFTVEHFVKCLIKFVVGYIVLSNLLVKDGEEYTGLIPWLVDGIGDISKELLVAQAKGGIDIDNPLVTTWYDLYKGNWLNAIGVYAGLILPTALSYIAQLVLMAFAIGRIVELAILVIFSPVGVSNLFGHGEQNLGVKYLKKVAAVALQGIIMAYVCYCGSTIQGAMAGWNVISIIAVTCVEAVLVARSRNIANEIVGVH